MKKIKLYLETSVWNFLYADDAPSKKAETELFFDTIESGNYELYISSMVIAEIMRAPESKRLSLLQTIERYKPEELVLTPAVYDLANKYLNAGFVTEKAFDDLIHAAVATVNTMDFLVSWNLSHIVRARSIIGIAGVNATEGYRELRICTVLEVGDDET